MTPFEIADALRACLDAQFTDPDTRPAEICHRPGAEAPLSLGLGTDECCAGLAWVRVAGIEPVIDTATLTDPDHNPCQTTVRRVTLELGVVRCNPWGTNNAGPTCDQWTELALLMDQDATAMRNAVCCFRDSAVDDYGPVFNAAPGAWEPLESSGGCAGGTLLAVVYVSCREC